MSSTKSGHGDALIHEAQPVLPHTSNNGTPEVLPSKDPNYDDGLVYDHGWASSERGAERHRC